MWLIRPASFPWVQLQHSTIQVSHKRRSSIPRSSCPKETRKTVSPWEKTGFSKWPRNWTQPIDTYRFHALWQSLSLSLPPSLHSVSGKFTHIYSPLPRRGHGRHPPGTTHGLSATRRRFGRSKKTASAYCHWSARWQARITFWADTASGLAKPCRSWEHYGTLEMRFLLQQTPIPNMNA